MKKEWQKTRTLLFATWSLMLLLGCDKSIQPSPAGVNTQCIIQNETTALSGNAASWKYEYDSKGMPLKITKYGSNGAEVSGVTVYDDSVVNALGVARSTTRYDVDLSLKTLPTVAHVSATDPEGIVQADYKQFFFFYDAKSRLTKISEKTVWVGDGEWDLTISYNDKNNVTELKYEWVTGPITGTTRITATAYDDKPTPYASMPMWKFLMNNFAWDNYDPEPILTALSSNNPLDYSFGTGDNFFSRTMTYTYNEQGFPLARINTNKNKNGEYTFTQTFSYTCP
ncbi:MAG TPA: hypothetical protein VIU12_18235 [Chryseolinea sp.]